MNLREPLPELFTQSRIITLDFSKIPKNTPDDENIEMYFQDMAKQGKNPRLPQNRQAFNDRLLKKTGVKYLVGQYAEDRVAMLADTPAGAEDRTIHMALDIFASDLEVVKSPCDGVIVRSDYEAGFGEYGNYLIIQPDNQDYYIFLGHLAADRHQLGRVTQGKVVGHLGDYADNENGGWSRHPILWPAKLTYLRLFSIIHKTSSSKAYNGSRSTLSVSRRGYLNRND